MKERRRMDAVDAALDAARDEARDARLPPALRARILAAARPVPAHDAPAPRGRVIDFVLRAAAVAAALAAVVYVAPMSLEAAEFDARPLVEMNDRLTETVARHLPDFDAAGGALPEVSAGGAWMLGAAAVLLVGAGLVAARRGDAR